MISHKIYNDIFFVSTARLFGYLASHGFKAKYRTEHRRRPGEYVWAFTVTDELVDAINASLEEAGSNHRYVRG